MIVQRFRLGEVVSQTPALRVVGKDPRWPEKDWVLVQFWTRARLLEDDRGGSEVLRAIGEAPWMVDSDRGPVVAC